jgi:hypothetical protein
MIFKQFLRRQLGEGMESDEVAMFEVVVVVAGDQNENEVANICV